VSITLFHGPEPGLDELGVEAHAYQPVRRPQKERSCVALRKGLHLSVHDPDCTYHCRLRPGLQRAVAEFSHIESGTAGDGHQHISRFLEARGEFTRGR